MTLKALFTTAALLLTAAGCSTTEAEPNAGPLPPANATTVEVSNHNWSDMVVYAVRSGARYRLGMVTSMSSERLEIPRGVTAPSGKISLVADPIGGSEQFRTGPIQFAPGQMIELNIQNHLAISHYAVWD